MAELYERLLRPLIFKMDPEAAHDMAVGALSRAHGLAKLAGQRVEDPRLAQEHLGIRFPNPVGLAAGFDKYARAIPAWPHLGFGFVEVGSVTALAQPGNPKPRIFRLPEDLAVINRLGFNNDGAAATAARLEVLRTAGELGRIPLGINIGKSKDAPLDDAVTDYLTSFRALSGFADYVVVNVSSPNTPGLRTLQDRPALAALLGALADAAADGHPPILVKIAPDLTDPQVDEVVSLVEELDIAGIVVSNTTISRDGLRSPEALALEGGGLSGRPVRARSTALVRRVRAAVGPRRLIIGVGGIFDADDAWEKLAAGAGLVQIYTGFVYGGPRAAARINAGLLARLDREGAGSISEIVGSET